MTTLYATSRYEQPRESTRSLTMIVIEYPVRQDQLPARLDAHLPGYVELPAEDEPTWEDAAWV